MEAKDLRIGNWVYLSSHKKDIGEVHLGFNNTNLDLFEPIELTEEWAVRLGKTINGLKVQSSGYPDGDLYIDNEGEGYYLYNCSDGYRFGKKIKYVHELQNLYYALTGGELTIK